MLDRSHRLTTSALFSTATRRGRRAGTRTMVLHLLTGSTPAERRGHHEAAAAPLVGFVVSKAVGNAVARNRVKRRLRHLVRARLTALPGDGVLVVRALPAAAEASSARLARDLETALHRLVADPSTVPVSAT